MIFSRTTNEMEPDKSIISFPVPIEPQLALPSKLTVVQNTVANKCVNDIPGMDFNDDKGVHLNII